MAVQFTQAFFTPHQMIDFFCGGLLHLLAHVGELGGQGLALVQRLGADFAGVVDPHQARHMFALAVVSSDSL